MSQNLNQLDRNFPYNPYPDINRGTTSAPTQYTNVQAIDLQPKAPEPDKEKLNIRQGLPCGAFVVGDGFTCFGPSGSTISGCTGCTGTIGCTVCDSFPIKPLELEFLYANICKTCYGSTSIFCDLWNDNTTRGAIINIVNTLYCTVSNFTCNAPGKCLLDFLTGSTGGFCSGDLNPEKRDCAVKAFLQQSGLPPFPTNFVTETISSAILGFSSRSIAYTYLPLFILFFLGIWIMVAVGWIGIGAGILFTVGIGVILYFFFVSYRASFEVYVNTNIQNIDAEVKAYTKAVNEALPKIPGAAASALCVYTGNCFGCTGGLPECSGCTGATGATQTMAQPCFSGCEGVQAPREMYNE